MNGNETYLGIALFSPFTLTHRLQLSELLGQVRVHFITTSTIYTQQRQKNVNRSIRTLLFGLCCR